MLCFTTKDAIALTRQTLAPRLRNCMRMVLGGQRSPRLRVLPAGNHINGPVDAFYSRGRLRGGK